MRILFIGGTRFIGLSAVRQLHENGHQLTLLHRGQTRADLPDGIDEILGDKAALETHAGAIKEAAPEVVVHMMAVDEGDARRLVEVCRGVARRTVVISSGDVYLAYGRLLGTDPGPPVPLPVTEESPLREKLYPYRAQAAGPADWRYHYDKILVEQTAQSEPDLPATILRLPMVYGPRDYQRRIFPYLKRMDDGRPAILLDRKLAAWRAPRSFVEDVGAAIALAATDERASGRIYNVAEADALTEEEWVAAIGRAAGWQGEIVTVDPGQIADSQRWKANGQQLVIDSSRIRAELGFQEPVSRAEGLRRTVGWERANPPENINPAQFDYAREDEILSELED
jgi:nucleoside-diphosphate-sugar epimerase